MDGGLTGMGTIIIYGQMGRKAENNSREEYR